MWCQTPGPHGPRGEGGTSLSYSGSGGWSANQETPAPPSSQVSKQGSGQDVGSWSPGLPACLPVVCLRPLSLLQAAHATAASHLSVCVLLTELEVRSHTSILCAVKQMQEELGRLLLRGNDRTSGRRAERTCRARVRAGLPPRPVAPAGPPLRPHPRVQGSKGTFLWQGSDSY